MAVRGTSITTAARQDHIQEGVKLGGLCLYLSIHLIQLHLHCAFKLTYLLLYPACNAFPWPQEHPIILNHWLKQVNAVWVDLLQQPHRLKLNNDPGTLTQSLHALNFLHLLI